MAAYCLIPNLYIQTAKKKKLVLKTLKSKTLANRGVNNNKASKTNSNSCCTDAHL